MSFRSVPLVVLLAVVVGCSADGQAAAPPTAPTTPTATSAVGPPDVDAGALGGHLDALQRVARENGGNRAAGGEGYLASVRYLRGKLDAAGYRTRLQTVPLPTGGSTVNLIADRPGGDDRAVLLTGAHLDSVSEGPGINDNASGAAAVLEVALAVARTGYQPRRHLRFAWWGGEELGLLGSSAYVAGLPDDERESIAGYLNVDMVGSPNAGYFVYDGDDSDKTGAGPGPAGSAEIEQALVAAFDGLGVPTEGTDFSGRSDYGPFVQVGIPAGGTFTGAEGVKTAEQARKWGGRAGAPYDPCYHQACDTTANVDRRALDRNADALTAAVWALAAG